MHGTTSDGRRTTAAGIVPTDADRVAARRILDELGEAGAATKTRLARASIQKIAAGSPVRYGTLVAFRFGTGLIRELPMDAAGEVVE